MPDLQATVEFSVELGKIFNVDLFQRGFYQVRCILKLSQRCPSKIDVKLLRDSEEPYVMPACLINGSASSKVVKVMFRNEDVPVNDVFHYIIHLLVDSNKIEESIDTADFQLFVELWFSEEDTGSGIHDSLECVSQRALNLHLTSTKGLHHYVPVLFDYFHLSAIEVTIHGALIALHQPYMPALHVQRQNRVDEPWTLESVYLNSSKLSNVSAEFYPLSRLHDAYRIHQKLCSILLSAHESMQSVYQTYANKISSLSQKCLQQGMDCHARLEAVMNNIQTIHDHDDLMQVVSADLTQLCAENVILWTDFLDDIIRNNRVHVYLAKEHHYLRVKRFAEAFYMQEHSKPECLECFDPGLHGHTDLVTVIRSSPYFQCLPTLPVECLELDGDNTTLPVIFEDVYINYQSNNDCVDNEYGETKDKVGQKGDMSCRSDTSSNYSLEDLSIKPRNRAKKRFIKNVRPDTLKRPSTMNHPDYPEQPHGTDVVLLGYRRTDSVESDVRSTQLGTFSPMEKPKTRDALSSPSTLLSRSCWSRGSADSFVHDSNVLSKQSVLKAMNIDRSSAPVANLSQRFASPKRMQTDMRSNSVDSGIAQSSQTLNVRCWDDLDSTSPYKAACDDAIGDNPRDNRSLYTTSSISYIKEGADISNLDKFINGEILDEAESQSSNGNQMSHSSSASSEISESLNDVLTVNELLKLEYARSVKRKQKKSAHKSKKEQLTNSSRTFSDPNLHVDQSVDVYNKHETDRDGKTDNSLQTHPIPASASSPELFKFNQLRLIAPVPSKTISFVTAKEDLKKALKYSGILYSDIPSNLSKIPYFHVPSNIDDEVDGIHLIICHHGLDGNRSDLRLVRTYLEMALPGYPLEFLMCEQNQYDTFADFQIMTEKLICEIKMYLSVNTLMPARISFIGHSLGNLIIRSALSHPDLAHLLPKLHTFLSLSGPHLGTVYNTSGLVNMGMWFMQKWKKSGSLLQLALKDHADPRQCFLYKLSKKPALEYFKNILLVSSAQDRYVPYNSTRIEICRAAQRDSGSLGRVYCEMVNNLLQPIISSSHSKLIRYDVHHALPNTANTMIGRAAHIAVLDSEIFLEKFLNVAALKYFK